MSMRIGALLSVAKVARCVFEIRSGGNIPRMGDSFQWTFPEMSLFILTTFKPQLDNLFAFLIALNTM
jgi:hypothetical protein